MLLSGTTLPALLRAPRALKIAEHKKYFQILALPTPISAPRPTDDMQVDNPLAPQAFASNRLDRSAGDKRDPAFVGVALRTPLLLFVNGAAVCVSGAESRTALFWAAPRDLESLGLGISRDQVTSLGSNTVLYSLFNSRKPPEDLTNMYSRQWTSVSQPISIGARGQCLEICSRCDGQ